MGGGVPANTTSTTTVNQSPWQNPTYQALMLGTKGKPGPITNILRSNQGYMDAYNTMLGKGITPADVVNSGKYNPTAGGAGTSFQEAAPTQTAADGGIMSLQGYASGGDPAPKDLSKAEAARLQRLNNRIGYGQTLSPKDQRRLENLTNRQQAYQTYQADQKKEETATADAQQRILEQSMGQTAFTQVNPITGRLESTNPLFNQAVNRVMDAQQLPSQFGQATDIMNQAAQQLQAASGKSWADPGTAQAYMNPYIETALKSQQDLANRQFAQQQNQLRSQAAGRGAFGGSASALAEQAAQQNQNMTLKDLVAQGMNQAYQQGQQGFMSDQARAIQALNQMGIMGQGLGGLGASQASTNLANIGALGQAASAWQNLGQQYLNTNTQNAQNAINFPSNLYSGALNAINAQPSTGGTTTATGTSSPASWMGRAEGGEVEAHKEWDRAKGGKTVKKGIASRGWN